MKFESVTIKDIAKALGLSPSTVSRALRGSYEISGDTKKLVTEYAGKMNYRPNPIAQSLKERRSHSIGIIVSEIANNFFSQAINGIESVAYSRGYHVIISQSHESYDREVINVEHLASRSVDGLLVSISNETKDLSHLKNLHNRGLPIVFFDRVTPEIKTHQVVANNFIGAFNATEHLIHEGFSNIAHITNAPSLSITSERLAGYRAALENHGLPFTDYYVRYCHHGGMLGEEMDEAIDNLLAQPHKPDAILTASDRLTMGCLKALVRNGVQVPAQMGIAGFTNTSLADMFHPQLTTIRQPAFEMGKQATEMLLKLIESKRPVTEFETRVLETELIIRESSVKEVAIHNRTVQHQF